MSRFGFGADPPMDYPADQMEPSGSYRKGHVISERSRFVDVGRMAIGQGLLLATPLQMCSVAQAIANGGVRMEPRLVGKVVDPDGRTVETPTPHEAERVMSSQTAAELTAMMKQVVKEGTGTAAALQGVDLAGKTGTAEIDIANGINDLWFIGFTDKDAVAVVISHAHGTGGPVAGPVAKQVLEALGS
jgi:peptidoglycan glycosyltransferase